jgi:hypothetical protein
MADIKKIIRQLNLGILPDELNFNLTPPDEIDWAKVQYNTFYKSKDYFIGKMPHPEAFMKLPGADLIIQSIIDNVKTPLEEMKEREEIKISDININNESNSEQSSN